MSEHIKAINEYRNTMNKECDDAIAQTEYNEYVDDIITEAIKKAFGIKSIGSELRLYNVEPDKVQYVVYALAKEVHRLRGMVAKRISVIQSLDHALANTRDIICKHWQAPEPLQE